MRNFNFCILNLADELADLKLTEDITWNYRIGNFNKTTVTIKPKFINNSWSIGTVPLRYKVDSGI